MGAANGDILGFAVGVAISPDPIIAAILMLFTSRAVANSLGFLLGWLMGLAVPGSTKFVTSSATLPLLPATEGVSVLVFFEELAEPSFLVD